jgi:hypothetical protein
LKEILEINLRQVLTNINYSKKMMIDLIQIEPAVSEKQQTKNYVYRKTNDGLSFRRWGKNTEIWRKIDVHFPVWGSGFLGNGFVKFQEVVDVQRFGNILFVKDKSVGVGLFLIHDNIGSRQFPTEHCGHPWENRKVEKNR